MSDDPSLTVLRALQSIQKTGSVSQTATALGVTQSAISRSISRYEKAVGLTLLNRAARPLVLTEEGKLAVAHAIEIDRGLKTLTSRLMALKQGKAGEVRIGSFGPSASTRILPGLLRQFSKTRPEISVSILEGSDEQTRNDLINGNVDIAVLCDPVDAFDAVPVATDQLVALVPEESSLSQNTIISPTDIHSTPFIMTLAGSETAIWDWFATDNLTPNIKHRIQQSHSMLALVRANMGVAIVTSLSLPEVFQGVAVKPLTAMSERQIYVVKKPEAANSNAATIFWNFLTQTIDV